MPTNGTGKRRKDYHIPTYVVTNGKGERCRASLHSCLWANQRESRGVQSSLHSRICANQWERRRDHSFFTFRHKCQPTGGGKHAKLIHIHILTFLLSCGRGERCKASLHSCPFANQQERKRAYMFYTFL